MGDFTFPTVPRGQCNLVTEPFFPPHHHHQLGLGSPPPWFAAAIADAGGGGHEEEKMDMLWEDFNEELVCTTPVCPLSPLNYHKYGGMMEKEAWLDVDDDDGAGFGFVGGEKERRGIRYAHDGRVVRRRRWSLLLMLRLLKKLFLVKKARNPRTAPI